MKKEDQKEQNKEDRNGAREKKYAHRAFWGAGFCFLVFVFIFLGQKNSRQRKTEEAEPQRKEQPS